MMKRRTWIAGLGLMLVIGANAIGSPASPPPTPEPGGANQQAGVSGPLSSILFNGVLRLKRMNLRDPIEKDKMHPNAPSTHAIVFTAIVSNGTKESTHGFFNALLSDADGITTPGRVLDDGWDLQPGAAARIAIGFSLPDNFVPTKIILIEAARSKAKAFRILLTPAEVPSGTL